jgi:hypothetical protein
LIKNFHGFVGACMMHEGKVRLLTEVETGGAHWQHDQFLSFQDPQVLSGTHVSALIEKKK